MAKAVLTEADIVTSSNVLDEFPVQETNETDEEILERIGEKIEILKEMTQAVKNGYVKSLIVTGGPGVGKSHGVNEVLSKYDTLASIAGNTKLKKYEIVKGAISPLGLYCKLYEYSDEKSIVVFDDNDSAFGDEVSLNILKAALDSNSTRSIHWNSDSRKLRTEGIPNSFEFKGGCIFITNVNFNNIRSKKLKDHISALESRSHFLDLTIRTEREKMLHIKNTIKNGLLDHFAFEDYDVDEIVDFIDANRKQLRELSLRTVIKVAELKKFTPRTWRRIAEQTVLKA